MEQIHVNYELQKIRRLFREFYGELPVLELSQNSRLTKKIEELEKQLKGIIYEQPIP